MATPLRKCMACRERKVHRTTLEQYSIRMDHDGRSYDLIVDDLEVLQCENCGSVVLEDSANKRISDSLRREVGLLLPEEIVASRTRLGLTQKQLASYLKIAESTLCRWETGAQIQQRAMDGLLRVFFQSAEARAVLGLPQFENGAGTVAFPTDPRTVLTTRTGVDVMCRYAWHNYRDHFACFDCRKAFKYWQWEDCDERQRGNPEAPCTTFPARSSAPIAPDR